MPKKTLLSGCLLLVLMAAVSLPAGQPRRKSISRDFVKVAAVQVSGYDKGDVPREGYDPTQKLLPYIDRAGRDGVQLVVFPEYVLGRIKVPGPTTDKLAAAARANAIYVIVGCWEPASGARR
jgi:predicted amidohydrolase